MLFGLVVLKEVPFRLFPFYPKNNLIRIPYSSII